MNIKNFTPEKISEIKLKLCGQGIWKREVDELIGELSNDIDLDNLNIIEIYDTAFDLGEDYIDNEVPNLDSLINACLEYSNLGRKIAEDAEYICLSSGRIVQFNQYVG